MGTTHEGRDRDVVELILLVDKLREVAGRLHTRQLAAADDHRRQLSETKARVQSAAEHAWSAVMRLSAAVKDVTVSELKLQAGEHPADTSIEASAAGGGR